MQTKIIIQARTGSTRLPNKILLPFHNSKSILDSLISNLKSGFPQNQIILATSTSVNDANLKSVALNHDIAFFQGSENDVLKRFLDCAMQFEAKTIVRICADNPFLMVDYLKPLIESIENNETQEYISYEWPDKTPVMLSHIGLFAEAFKLSFLQKIDQLTADPFYHEHVTNYLYPNRADFKANFLPIPELIEKRKDIRLTIDTETDFELCQEIYANWQECEMQDLKSLCSVIDQKPLLLTKMKQEIKKNEK